MIESGVRHVLCRHEQGAGHAAEGYAWATGKVGVAIATSGPGGCNLVTALADAKMDSVPIVAITGQVPTPVVGNDAFQEADITGITMPVTKHNFLVTDPGEVAETIREAFHIARTGRPGPVLVDLPKDVLVNETTWSWPDQVDLPGYKPTTKGNMRQVVEAAKLILEAKRPVLYVGGGVIKAEATEELFELATVGHLPVVTTLMARGAFPDAHELCLGMPGMHGVYTAVTAMQKADLLVAVGARFDDRVTGQLADVRAGREDRPHRHRSRGDRQEPQGRRPDRGRLQGRDHQARRGAHAPSGRGRHPGPEPMARPARGVEDGAAAPLRPAGRRAAQAPVRDRAAPRAQRRRHDRRRRRRPAPDVGVAVLVLREASDLDQLGRPRHDGLRGARRRSAPRRASPTAA